MPRLRLVNAAAGLAFALAVTVPLTGQQLPLAPTPRTGAIVTPVFEGWYPNKDGTFSISPGAANQGQPSHFEPKRHWGVFAVKVPADFGKKEVVWTLKVHGVSNAIPGSLHPNWQIDALEGEAGSGNTPPVLKWSETGVEGAGPFGITGGPVAASVGKPVTLTVWARDDGKSSGSVASAGRGAVPVALT